MAITARPEPALGWWRAGACWRQRLLLPAVVGAVQLGATLAAAQHQTSRKPIDALGVFLLLVGPFSLAFMRRHPAAVLLTTFGATLAYATIGYRMGPIYISLIIAFINAVMMGRRAVAWSTLGAGYVSFLWLAPALGRDTWPTAAEIVGLAAWLLCLATAAEVVRVRRESAMERARALREEAERRSGEERLRIARELHDVLAHNISLINVQAGVALHLMDEQP